MREENILTRIGVSLPARGRTNHYPDYVAEQIEKIEATQKLADSLSPEDVSWLARAHAAWFEFLPKADTTPQTGDRYPLLTLYKVRPPDPEAAVSAVEVREQHFTLKMLRDQIGKSPYTPNDLEGLHTAWNAWLPAFLKLGLAEVDEPAASVPAVAKAPAGQRRRVLFPDVITKFNLIEHISMVATSPEEAEANAERCGEAIQYIENGTNPNNPDGFDMARVEDRLRAIRFWQRASKAVFFKLKNTTFGGKGVIVGGVESTQPKPRQTVKQAKAKLTQGKK